MTMRVSMAQFETRGGAEADGRVHCLRAGVEEVRGQMSIVPPARSMRVGADVTMGTGIIRTLTILVSVPSAFVVTLDSC